MPKKRVPRVYKVTNIYPEYATEEEREEAMKQKERAMQEVYRIIYEDMQKQKRKDISAV